MTQPDMTAFNRFVCVTKTPFGSPVDPDVYMIMAMSSGVGLTIWQPEVEESSWSCLKGISRALSFTHGMWLLVFTGFSK